MPPLCVAFCHLFHGCTEKELQQQQKAMKARCKLKGGKKVVVGTLSSSTTVRFSSSFPPLGTLCHVQGWFTIHFLHFFHFYQYTPIIITYRWWNVAPLMNMEDFEFLSWSSCKNYKNGGCVIWKFIPTLCLLIKHASYFYVIWVVTYFQEVWGLPLGVCLLAST